MASGQQWRRWEPVIANITRQSTKWFIIIIINPQEEDTSGNVWQVGGGLEMLEDWVEKIQWWKSKNVSFLEEENGWGGGAVMSKNVTGYVLGPNVWGRPRY